MPVTDWDGTTSSKIAKIFDWDGTTSSYHKRAFDWDGTTSTTVFTEELDLMATPSATWRGTKLADTSQSGQTGAAVVTITDTYLRGETINGSYVTAACSTRSAINFSNYTKIKITGYFHGDTVKDSGYVTRARCVFGCSTNSTIAITHSNGIILPDTLFSGGKKFFDTAPVMSGTFTYDISNLNGSYYLKILAVRGGLAPSAYFNVTSVILE